jgi:ABC-type polysaccharide/polyol phosphate export permease
MGERQIISWIRYRLRKSLGSLKLCISIVVADYTRRFAPTFLGSIWFLAPLFTVFALSGTPSNITGLGATPNQLLQVACYVCGIQLITDCATETARLARRNRPLLPKLGNTSSVINFAGILESQILFLIKVVLSITMFLALGANLQSARNVAITMVYWNLSLLVLGLILSHLVSYLSILVLDVRYAAQFLPMLLVLLSGVYSPLSSLTESGSAWNVTNPVLSIGMLTESASPRLGHEFMFSSVNALLLWVLSRLSRHWQIRIARVAFSQYL